MANARPNTNGSQHAYAGFQRIEIVHQVAGASGHPRLVS
jgi:hypothetical protein